MIILLADLSTSWQVVLQAIIAGIVTMVLGYFQMRTKNSIEAASNQQAKIASIQKAETVQVKESLANATKAAAVQVSEVKKTLDDNTQATAAKLEGLHDVAVATHTLVNSNMGNQLKISALALRRIADMTKHQDDEMAAALAEGLLAEHMARQAIVDQKIKDMTV
jgi:hypothetical protein